MATFCMHPFTDMDIQGFLPDGQVRADCSLCGQRGVIVKYSDSFDDRLDVLISDVSLLPDDQDFGEPE